MEIAPCKECKDRYPACHDHCQRYKEYKAKLAKNKIDKRNRELNDYVYERESRIFHKGRIK